MPQLIDLQKSAPLGREILEGCEEMLVVDRRGLLTPADQVDAKFWAALAAVQWLGSSDSEEMEKA